jgi:hypothetical protein
MRARQWVSGAILCSFVVVGMLQGCGTTPPIAALDSGADSTNDQGTPPVDSGGDSHKKTDAGHDAGFDAGIVDAPAEACGLDANLETIVLPDASIGTSSIGACLACTKASCNTQLEACNGDCACKEALVTVIECVAAGGAFLTCAEPVASEMNAENLALCVYAGCPVACGITAATPEGGADAPPDAPHDAPSEGG